MLLLLRDEWPSRLCSAQNLAVSAEDIGAAKDQALRVFSEVQEKMAEAVAVQTKAMQQYEEAQALYHEALSAVRGPPSARTFLPSFPSALPQASHPSTQPSASAPHAATTF
jgi:hypothetical protein